MAKRKSVAELAAEAATEVETEVKVKIHEVPGKPGAPRAFLRALATAEGQESVKVVLNTPEVAFCRVIKIGEIICLDERTALSLLAAQRDIKDPNVPRRWEQVTLEV